MAIPLPEPAWWVELTPECDYANSPLGKDFDKFNLGLDQEDFPQLYVKKSFDGNKLKGDPRVKDLKEIWYICPYQFTRPHEEIDGLNVDDYFRERLGGQFVSNCFGMARVYQHRQDALADLAKCDQGVSWVWQAARVRTGPAGKLARAVLAGELDSLPALASALAEANHPLAEPVKELSAPRKKGRSGKRK